MCLAMDELEKDWRAEGKAEGIIETGLDCGVSDSDILKKLQQKMQISLQQAQEYLTMFTKQHI